VTDPAHKITEPDVSPVVPPQADAGQPEQAVASIIWVDANGTMWRLRSLVAMGHSATRMATALHVRLDTVQKLLRGEVALVGSDLRNLTCLLWTAWWDKRPPGSTRPERQAAASARRRAERNDWCAPAGLDEDLLDQPGYRPYCRYRPATGTGIADDFSPADRISDTRGRA
jgi:hypothetical protein